MLKREPFVLLIVGLVAINAAAVDDSSSEDVDDVAQSSMFGTFGSKVAIADNVYEDDDDDEEDDELGEQVTPCCFPSVWQGRLETEFGFAPIGGGRPPRSDDDDDKDFDRRGKQKKRGGGDRRGRPLASRSVNQVYVDGNNKRLAGNVLESHGKDRALNFSYILLVGANQTADLYLFNRAAQKCRYRQLKGAVWRPQCIPANATLRGQFSLGPASGGLSVQSWSFFAGSRRAKEALIDGDYSVLDDDDLEGPNDVPTTPRPRPRPQPPRPKVFLAATALVVPGSCVPVVVQEEGVVLVGGRRDGFQNDNDDDNNNWDPKPGPKPRPKPKPRGEAFVGSAFYSGLQTTITDPSVFTVPAYCKKTPNTMYYDEMEDELPSVVERFLVL
jgi:hypothetical protein